MYLNQNVGAVWEVNVHSFMLNLSRIKYTTVAFCSKVYAVDKSIKCNRVYFSYT